MSFTIVPQLLFLFQIALFVLLKLYQILLIPGDLLSRASAYVFRNKARRERFAEKKRVVIIGGGFAGSMAATCLENDYDVTLIDNKKYFEFTPSTLRSLVEPEHASVIQRAHLHYLRKASVVNDVVSNVNRRVVTTPREQIPYDYLVIATGASYSTFPGEASPTSPLVSARFSPLSALHQSLIGASHVLVIGGGTVGVELAAEIRHHYPDIGVTLAGPILARSPPRASAYAESWLRRKGVTLLPNEKVMRYDSEGFHTARGLVIKCSLAFNCTGNIPNTQFMKHSKEFSDSLNERGFVLVNEHLQVEGYDNVYAAGDVNFIPGEDEKLCPNALAEGALIAANIRLSAKKKGTIRLNKYSPWKRPMLVSLGPHDAILIYRNFTMCGWICAIMKEFVEWKEMLKFYDSLLPGDAHRYSKHHTV